MVKTKESKAKNPYVKWFFVHVLNHKALFTINFIGIVAVTYTRTIIPIRIGAITDSIIQKLKPSLGLAFLESSGFGLMITFTQSLIITMLILLVFYFLRNIVEYTTWMIGHQLGSKTNNLCEENSL